MRRTKETLSRRHEEELAELLPEGQQTIASGAKHEKHDVKTKRGKSWWRFLVEAKCTQSKGFRVTEELWKEVKQNALLGGPEQRPALAIRFYGDSKESVARTPIQEDLVLVDLHDWLELLEEVRHYTEAENGPSV